jgi:hypothetical protein
MDTLNDKFSSTTFSFNFVNTTYTSNSAWRSIAYGSQAEYDMKSGLRYGSYQDVNIYINTMAKDSNGGTLLGYAWVFSIASLSQRPNAGIANKVV